MRLEEQDGGEESFSITVTSGLRIAAARVQIMQAVSTDEGIRVHVTRPLSKKA